MQIKTFSLIAALFTLTYTLVAQTPLLTKEQAVQLALNNNFGVIIANNNVKIAENNSNILNSGFLPALSATAGANYGRDDSTIEFPGQLLEDGTPRPDVEIEKAENQRYNGGLNLNYTLFDGLGRWYNYKRLNEEYNLSELQARETIENTMLQLFTVYFEMARLSENVSVLSQTFKNTKNRLRRAEYSFDYGQTNKLDVLNAQVDLVNDSINLMNERQTLKNTRRDLNLLINRDLTENFTVDTTITFINELKLQEYLLEAESNNIRLLQAEKNMIINDYTLKASKSVFLPTIGLTGSYGWNLNQSAASAFFPGTNNSTLSLGVGANLTWNLFDGGSGITQVKNAKILLDTQDTLQEQIEQEVKRDIANAKGDFENRLEIFHLQEQNVNTATNNYNRSNEQYKLGQITSVELRQAQLNLLNANTSKNLAKYNAKLAELQLLQLAGQLLNTKL
ncbi:TolC family protein [Croceitalea vernalis]|uniref:TolC family protein n=1 Tax=Croceitalea vernalis TaxID=3075599 RepID=A0ABU3BCX2_9FLAO|nr:TolC family protein [Croceitalea sp. P007]MDT0619983.1 TolC family protein [Croceitalea sp. P007]